MNNLKSKKKHGQSIVHSTLYFVKEKNSVNILFLISYGLSNFMLTLD